MDCPWKTRAEFQAASRGSQMNELRDLLASTITQQSRFLARRMEQSLPKMTAAAPANRREHVRRQFERLAATGKGTFALIDYVNFKGEGTNPKERYKGEGWGLLQVLEGMDADVNPPAKAFGDSAARVLARRVKNSPAGPRRIPLARGMDQPGEIVLGVIRLIVVKHLRPARSQPPL